MQIKLQKYIHDDVQKRRKDDDRKKRNKIKKNYKKIKHEMMSTFHFA